MKDGISDACNQGRHYECLGCRCACAPRPQPRPAQPTRQVVMTGGAAIWHPGDDELWAG